MNHIRAPSLFHPSPPYKHIHNLPHGHKWLPLLASCRILHHGKLGCSRIAWSTCISKIVHSFCHLSRPSNSYFIFCSWLWLFSELLGWGRGTLTMETMAGCLPNSSPSFLANRTLIWVLELGSNTLREAAPVPEGLNPFWKPVSPLPVI